MGIQPDIIVCRSEIPLTQGIRDKIALFCNVPSSRVLQNLDVEYLYEAPLAMEREHLAQAALECLKLPCPKPDLGDWISMVEALRHPTTEVTIALVGKYTQLHDAYLSVVEALKHGGIASRASVSRSLTSRDMRSASRRVASSTRSVWKTGAASGAGGSKPNSSARTTSSTSCNSASLS